MGAFAKASYAVPCSKVCIFSSMKPPLGSVFLTFLLSANAGRALDTRSSSPKRRAASTRGSFSDSAHPCVRAPLMQAQWHVLPPLQFHNNCSFALTQPHPCMKLAELRGLVLRTRSGLRTWLPAQVVVEDGASYTA